jgi:hypothetical protein
MFARRKWQISSTTINYPFGMVFVCLHRATNHQQLPAPHETTVQARNKQQN